nr:MAG TPA: hypothetical protein [Caudoviricetes sp.]
MFSGLDYNTVFYKMSPLEIEMANVALDFKIKQDKQKFKK